MYTEEGDRFCDLAGCIEEASTLQCLANTEMEYAEDASTREGEVPEVQRPLTHHVESSVGASEREIGDVRCAGEGVPLWCDAGGPRCSRSRSSITVYGG